MAEQALTTCPVWSLWVVVKRVDSEEGQDERERSVVGLECKMLPSPLLVE